MSSNTITKSIEEFKIKSIDVFYKSLFTSAIRYKIFTKIKSFLEQGVDILTVLKSLRNSYQKLERPLDVRVYALNAWVVSIEKDAMKFHEALDGWATPNQIMLIKSGEYGGRIVEAMENAISATEAERLALSTVKSKLAYPTILLIILCSIAYMFSTRIVPEFERISNPLTWPSNAQTLYEVSNIIRDHHLSILLGFFGICFIVSWSLKNVTGLPRRYLDKLPIFGMYRSFQSSLFLVSLSSMMKSGVDLEHSLQQIRKKSPKYTKYQLSKVAERLDKGYDSGEAFNIAFFDEESRIDIDIYAKSKNIGDSIETIGKQSIKNGIEKISLAADIIKYLMMFAIVGYIGWSYMGFYSLVQAISQNA